jgi:hypothetical protein
MELGEFDDFSGCDGARTRKRAPIDLRIIHVEG